MNLLNKIDLKRVLILIFIFSTILSCSPDEVVDSPPTQDKASKTGMTNIVSDEDYTMLSNLEKGVVDLINSSINGLKGLSLHPESNLSEHYYATIDISTKNTDKGFSNYILLSSKNTSDYRKKYSSRTTGSSCTACGIRSGISCARKIVAHMEDGGLSSLEVSIEINSDGCYEISW